MIYLAYVEGYHHIEIPLPLKHGSWKGIVADLKPYRHLLVIMESGEEFDRLRSSIYWRARKCGMPVSITKFGDQLEVRLWRE